MIYIVSFFQKSTLLPQKLTWKIFNRSLSKDRGKELILNRLMVNNNEILSYSHYLNAIISSVSNMVLIFT